PVAVLALVCLGAGTVLGWQVLARSAPPQVLHTMIPPPRGTDYDLGGTAPGPSVLSPDGTMLTFTAVGEDGTTQLYLRHLDKGESVGLSGTAGAAYPFWAPDSRFIGFFDMTGQKLRKVAVAGGPPVTLCPAPNGKGGSWNRDGDIIFAPDYNTSIHRVPAIGGDAVPITRVGTEHDSHRHPRFLHDGRRFLFTARATAAGQANSVFVASLDTSVAPRVVTETQAHADYADGHLLTVREGVLMATPFAPDQERVTDGGTPLVENLLVLPGAAVAAFGPSTTGMLVFQTGSSAAGRQLSWTDLGNGGLQALGEPGQIHHPAISPDGTRAVVEMRGGQGEGTDLWLVDLVTGLRTRFTFAPGDELAARWSRSGEFVFYSARSDGKYSIIQQPVEGQGGAAVVLESSLEVFPTSLGPGDRDLLLDYEREDGRLELRRLDLAGSGGEPETVAAAADANLGGGQYSPDGRWIAYHTQTTAGWDVFVIPAAGGARKWQITSDGAVYPKWSHDGAELWVSRFSGELRAYTVDGSGQTFRAGTFRQPVTIGQPDATGCYYDLHPDGLRILQTGADPAFRAEVSFLHLVTDWRRGLVQ
ncbi:MAG: hypothetical protein ABR506_00120, partial [Candidatus Krumholzibacteriia bacterium]